MVEGLGGCMALKLVADHGKQKSCITLSTGYLIVFLLVYKRPELGTEV